MTLHPPTLAHRLADLNEKDELTTMFCLFTDALAGVRAMAPLLTSWQGAWGEQEIWPLHARKDTVEKQALKCPGRLVHGQSAHVLACMVPSDT